ncbi:hypothetical protein DFS34DRAFT_619160 [Phlyctochytrium arcticum]|nr:hypothetical protein DFS34DRAFT_619160 [Phlyctochytrium arcticum]
MVLKLTGEAIASVCDTTAAQIDEAIQVIRQEYEAAIQALRGIWAAVPAPSLEKHGKEAANLRKEAPALARETSKPISHAWETVHPSETKSQTPKHAKVRTPSYRKHIPKSSREQHLIDRFWEGGSTAFSRKVDAFFESAQMGPIGTLNVQAASDSEIVTVKNQTFNIPEAAPVAERNV